MNVGAKNGKSSRRRGDCRGIKQEVAEEVRALAARAFGRGWRRCWWATWPPRRSMCAARCRPAPSWAFQRADHAARDVTTEEMLELVAGLNARDEIDGILIQLPLPAQVDTKALLDAVSPAKDVDGFHPVNAGRLQAGRPALAPCTPAGIIEILKRSGIPISGQHAVVVGRSDLVGKPAAMLLLHQNATVTICHSKTRDLGAITRQADILVAAIGRAGFITRRWSSRARPHRCGHQPHHRRARSLTAFFGRRQTRSCLRQKRLDDRGRRASQGLRAGRSLYARARRRGPADRSPC
jgi:hypothetical protein